jgi:hydrogenase nickel incorporation protein HypA/HybF
MHEFSLAAALLDQLLALAAAQHATRIATVHVRCGVLQQVVPEALELAFTAVTAETLAAGAHLELTVEPLAARCRTCQREFAPPLDDLRCPACRHADVDIVAGRDIVLQTVVCERAETP